MPKLRKHIKKLLFTSTWATGTLTVTTPVHGMTTGDKVSIYPTSFQNGQTIGHIAVTVTSTTAFTIPHAVDPNITSGYIEIENFSATATTDAISMNSVYPCTIQAEVEGTGAVTATVIVEVSNFEGLEDYITLTTFSLSGTTHATDGIAVTAPWRYIRSRVTAITGTGARVAVIQNS